MEQRTRRSRTSSRGNPIAFRFQYLLRSDSVLAWETRPDQPTPAAPAMDGVADLPSFLFDRPIRAALTSAAGPPRHAQSGWRPTGLLRYVGLDGDEIVCAISANTKVHKRPPDPRVALSVEAEGSSGPGFSNYLASPARPASSKAARPSCCDASRPATSAGGGVPTGRRTSGYVTAYVEDVYGTGPWRDRAATELRPRDGNGYGDSRVRRPAAHVSRPGRRRRGDDADQVVAELVEHPPDLRVRIRLPAEEALPQALPGASTRRSWSVRPVAVSSSGCPSRLGPGPAGAGREDRRDPAGVHRSWAFSCASVSAPARRGGRAATTRGGGRSTQPAPRAFVEIPPIVARRARTGARRCAAALGRGAPVSASRSPVPGRCPQAPSPAATSARSPPRRSRRRRGRPGCSASVTAPTYAAWMGAGSRLTTSGLAPVGARVPGSAPARLCVSGWRRSRAHGHSDRPAGLANSVAPEVATPSSS